MTVQPASVSSHTLSRLRDEYPEHPDRRVAAPTDAAVRGVRRTRTMRLMFVEDHTVVRTALREMLASREPSFDIGRRGRYSAGCIAPGGPASTRRHDHGSVPAGRERRLGHARALPPSARRPRADPDRDRQPQLRPRSVCGGRARVRAEGADRGRDRRRRARRRRRLALPALALRSRPDGRREAAGADRTGCSVSCRRASARSSTSSSPATATSASRRSCSSASRRSRRTARASTASWACTRASSSYGSPRCTAALTDLPDRPARDPA